jgi:hypothetical protein
MSRLRLLRDWALRTEESTRSSALIRIGLVPVIWARWADELLLYRDPSARGMALSLGFFVVTTLMLSGVLARLSTLATGIVLLTMYHYFGLVLGREPWTHHHTYLLAFGVFLVALTPCGKSYSFDRWWALRRAKAREEPAPRERANVWGLRLIALQLSTIYLFTAYDKTDWGFLSGDRLEHYLLWYYLDNLPESAVLHATAMLAAVFCVALEYALGIGLLFTRTRKWLIVPGLLVHGAFYLVLPVGTYSATVWCLYLAYLDPDAVHAFLERIQGRESRPDLPADLAHGTLRGGSSNQGEEDGIGW